MHDHVPSSDAPPAPPAPVETLRSFVSASFSADEFRRWIRELSPQNPNFAHGLPSPPVDDLKLFDDGVGLLERNKFIDSELLDSLARRFPRKLAELAAVADHTGIRWQPPEPSPKPWPPHHVGGSRSRTIQHLALVLLAIGATSVLAWTLLYLNREPTSPGIVAPTPTPAVMPDPVSDTSTSKVLMQHPSGEPQTATSIDHADESPPGRKTNEPTKSSTIIPDVATTKAVEQAPPPCKDVSPLLRQVLDKIASDCIADLTRQLASRYPCLIKARPRRGSARSHRPMKKTNTAYTRL